MEIEHNPNASYFDYGAQQIQAVSNTNKRYSQLSSIRPSHLRNWSDASDVSQNTEPYSPHSPPAELEGRSSFSRGISSIFRKVSNARKKSEPIVLQGGLIKTELGHIEEAGESGIQVDRYGIAQAKESMREEAVFVEGGPEYDQKFAGRGIDLLSSGGGVRVVGRQGS